MSNQPPRDLPFTTHDGVIWPQPRRRMTDALSIVARMAEDLAAIEREGEASRPVGRADLLARGWHARQVVGHGHAALKLYWEARGERDDLGRRLLTGAGTFLRRHEAAFSTVAEAGALSLLVACIGLYAALASGA